MLKYLMYINGYTINIIFCILFAAEGGRRRHTRESVREHLYLGLVYRSLLDFPLPLAR